MADEIFVQRRTLPWQPAENNTETIAEYHRYDVPLVGVVRQSGVDYLFRCLVGQAERISFWVYTILHEGEREALDAADYDDLPSLISEFGSHPGVLAVAAEGFGIVDSRSVSDPYAMDLRKVFLELLDSVGKLIEGLEREQETARSLLVAT